MMTIDEAIAHAREKAEQLKDHANKWKHSSEVCDSEFVREKAAEKCEERLECAKEHEQLAEWLEELKRYKAQKLVIKVDYNKAPALKELLRHSQFGIAYPEGQYEVVPLVTGGPSDEELKARRETDRWIPVSERLPEEEGRCLVTTNFGDVCMDAFEDGIFVLYLGNVIAWRPLPEPYKESGGKT